MFELIIFGLIVVGLGVISNYHGETVLNDDNEVQYPHIDDPDFEKKVKQYFKNKPMHNKFDHI